MKLVHSFFAGPDDPHEKEEILEPRLDKSSNSDEEAYILYNRYALAHGFRIKWCRTRNQNGRSFHTICSSREGFKSKKEFGEEVKKHGMVKRTGCLAAISLQKIDDGPGF